MQKILENYNLENYYKPQHVLFIQNAMDQIKRKADVLTQKKERARIYAKQIHTLSVDEYLYPDAIKIDLGDYHSPVDLDKLKIILEVNGENPCFINEKFDFTYLELCIIKDAMIKNPQLTFIAKKNNSEWFISIFELCGYSKTWLKKVKYRHSLAEKPDYAILFIG